MSVSRQLPSPLMPSGQSMRRCSRMGHHITGAAAAPLNASSDNGDRPSGNSQTSARADRGIGDPGLGGKRPDPALSGSSQVGGGPWIGTAEFAEKTLRRATEGSSSQTSGLAVAIAAMLKQPFSSHTLATIAAAAGMNRLAFERQFQDRFGVGPMEFLARERMLYAAHLLQNNTLSISQVGRRVGYPNRSEFSRTFQQWLGTSPSALRGKPPPGTAD